MTAVVLDENTGDASKAAGISNHHVRVFKKGVEKRRFYISLLDKNQMTERAMIEALREHLDDEYTRNY